MSRTFAFLRGLNVGGHRLAKPTLVAVFESLGLEEVDTFLASGNVIFTAGRSVGEEEVELALGDALGYPVPALLRSVEEVKALSEARPLPADLVESSKGKLQVVLVREPPSAATREDLLATTPEDDHLIFGEREVFWLPSGGVMESDLDFPALERALGVTTMRTKNTIERVAARFLTG